MKCTQIFIVINFYLPDLIVFFVSTFFKCNTAAEFIIAGYL